MCQAHPAWGLAQSSHPQVLWSPKADSEASSECVGAGTEHKATMADKSCWGLSELVHPLSGAQPLRVPFLIGMGQERQMVGVLFLT